MELKKWKRNNKSRNRRLWER